MTENSKFYLNFQKVERMLRLQTLRVVFDCKSNVLDAYNRQNRNNDPISNFEVGFRLQNRMSLMRNNVKSEHFPTFPQKCLCILLSIRKNAPITNFEGFFDCPIEMSLMLITVKSLNISKHFTKCLCICYLCIVEFSKGFLKFFFFVSLYNITSRKNAPISNFEGGFRLQIECP
ncbi:hypothetical protein AGLY_016877 [Aphis glycines]|uniref:Uncharacterized protein n=1 Tax=Aphis glycines TaxID=307491 RepID=A0A6G0SXA6_APHGL|nr:hypothetical protein AGLY_016877 [Aphis glycines]